MNGLNTILIQKNSNWLEIHFSGLNLRLENSINMVTCNIMYSNQVERAQEVRRKQGLWECPYLVLVRRSVPIC
jgi:hypothetical protein